MFRRPTTVCVTFCLATRALAGDNSQNIKVNGEISAGFEAVQFKNGESKYEVEIGAKTKRVNKTRGNIKAKADEDTETFFVQDAYIDRKHDGNRRLRLGRQKKRLGLEYELSEYERLSIDRSPLYRKLEEFAFVGREMIFEYRQKQDQGAWEREWSVSLGTAESLDVHTIAYYSAPVSDWTRLGTWTLLQADRIDAGVQFVWTQIISHWSEHAVHRYQWEIAAGKDPFASEFELTVGDSRSVIFYAAKTQYGARLVDSQGEGWEPVVQASVLGHDTKTPRYNTVQGLLGLNYYFSEQFRVALNIEMIATNSTIDLKTRTYDDSNAKLESKFKF